jgi:hypothetical protein
MVGEVNFPRRKMRHWVLVVACVGLLVGQTSLGVQAAEQKHSRIQVSDKKLTDEEFYKLLNKKLGNNYESLQVTISACNSGGFAHKDFVKPHLQGTWSVTAARDREKKVTRGATYADFEAALDDLNKKLTENPDNKGKESGFIYIWTHGEAEQRSDLRQPGSSPGLPGQGLVVAQNTTLTLTLDDAFLSNLYEEVLVDDPGITRTASPQFLLTTVDASLSGPVEVLIGGISIGYLSPSSDRYGNYEIDLDDDLLVAL